MTAAYAELQVTTNYSFLRGASHPEELFAEAAALGLPALGVTDRNSLAGMVRAHRCAKETSVRLVVGCRLDLSDGAVVLVYPTDRAGYGRLCQLLTLGKGRAGPGGCDLAWTDLAAHGEGLLAVLLPDAADAGLAAGLVLLCHIMWRSVRRWQHGHRSKVRASSRAMRARMVAMELATCRSGRIGGSPWPVVLGNVRCLDGWSAAFG